MISKYQADILELDKSLTEEEKFNFFIAIIDHFSKYAWAYPLVSKHGELIRDKLSYVIIIEHPDI